MAGDLAGKVVVVTGGARGIGRAIGLAFAREGARVCVADLSLEQSREAATEIGGEAFACALDVRSRASIAAAVAHVVAEAGGLDILVNCAGVFGMQGLDEISEDEFDRLFAVNTRGLLFMTQAGAAQMIAQGRGGAIVNVSSSAGRRGTAGATVYCATKAAAISITQSTALELVRHGIRVNCIAPNAVRTPMWDEVEQGFTDVFGDPPGTVEKVYAVQAPIGRMSSPEEHAGAVVFLASDAASFIIGQTINVDGGLFLQ